MAKLVAEVRKTCSSGRGDGARMIAKKCRTAEASRYLFKFCVSPPWA